jgi:hypothetical protein
MIRFNNYLTSNVIRQNQLVVKNQLCITTLRKFCEKKKTEEVQRNEEDKREDKESNESNRSWYTHLRKLRRFLAVLLKYSGLLLANYLIRLKFEFVENNLGFMKIDHFQRVLYHMQLSWLFMKDVFSLLSRQLPYLILPIFFLRI